MTDILERPEGLGDFFHPRNVVLVGASDRSTWSAMIHSRFAMWGHQGNLYAVNRDGKPAHGMRGFRTCSDIGEPIDLAYIYVPAEAAAEALRDAGRAGIRNAVLLTSGFSEAGEAGARLESDVAEVADRMRIRLLGPNSVGFLNLAARAVATSVAPRMPILPGRLACIAQSGAVVSELFYCAHDHGVGIGFFAATGNQMTMSALDIADHLIEDPNIGGILLYIESFTDPAQFANVAERALKAAKPLVILKLGRSALAREIAKAHTGADVGDDELFDQICQRFGVCRAWSIEELIVAGDLLERVGPIAPANIGVVSISGGGCAILADLAQRHGLHLAPFAGQTKSALREVLPSFAATINPLDATGVLMNVPALWSKVIPILADDPAFGLIAAQMPVPSPEAEIALMSAGYRAIVEGFKLANRKSVILGMTMQGRSEPLARLLDELGVDALIPGLDLGVRALAHLQNWSRAIEGQMRGGSGGDLRGAASATDEREAL